MRVFTLLGCLVACAAAAQTPRTIPFQGRLLTAAGKPVDGPATVAFRLYDAAAAPAPVWTETRRLAVAQGAVAVSLGETTPFPDSVRFDRPLWIGVQVGSDAEMHPRMPLGAAPFALQSGGLALPWQGSASTANGVAALRLDNPSAGGWGIRGGGYLGVVGWANGPDPPGMPIAPTGVFGTGVYGVMGMTAGAGTGVAGTSPHGVGSLGASEDGTGVRGLTSAGIGVRGGVTGLGQGVAGEALLADSLAILGTNPGGTAIAGRGLGADTDPAPPAAGVSGNGSIGVRAHSASGTGLEADSAGAGPAARIRNTGSGPAILLSGSGDILRATDKAGTERMALGASGDLRLSGPVAVPGTEYCLWLPAAAGLGAGDVAVIRTDGKVARCSVPYQAGVAGAVAESPAVAAGGGTGGASICILGAATVRVCDEGGPVSPGDALTTSSTPGCAMKASDISRLPNAMLGKALGGFAGPGTGTVRALITAR